MCIRLFAAASEELGYKELLFFKTQVLVFHVIQLPYHCQDPDDHEDRDRELNDNQDFPEGAVLGCRAKFSPKHGHGLEGRKNKSREAPCNKSRKDDNTKKAQEGGQFQELGRFELFAG